MKLNEDQSKRYSRQLIMDDIGPEGQEKIRESRVLVIGAGGLGSPAVLYLAAAGVGTLGIADGDSVDVSNLQRQILHFTADIGRPKTESASEKAVRLNPEVRVIVHSLFVSAGNIRELITPYDFILDCTDNFDAKFLINDTCVAAGKPFSHCGVIRLEGQTFTHLPGGPCLRCFLREAPSPEDSPTGFKAGVLGAAAGILGSIQAAEALKYITGSGELLSERLLLADIKRMRFHTAGIIRDVRCPVCGHY